MPEGLEVELYRRAATAVVGRRIAAASGDPRVVGDGVVPALVGAEVVAIDRVGKLLLLDTDRSTVGLHFGMTGRLVVDGVAPIERLEYGAARDDAIWDRFTMSFDDGGTMRVNDPRRWASVVLDPDTSARPPDLLSITAGQLAGALGGRRTSVKAVLLDQRAVAGMGNMCTDEVLWHAGVSPQRSAAALDGGAVRRLHRAMRRHLPDMLDRGGSHTGTISPAVRAALPPCPRDGEPLRRDRVAGRTTVWCPAHQR